MKISEIVGLLEKYKTGYGDMEVQLQVYDSEKYGEPEYLPTESVGFHLEFKKDGSSQYVATIGNFI